MGLLLVGIKNKYSYRSIPTIYGVVIFYDEVNGVLTMFDHIRSKYVRSFVHIFQPCYLHSISYEIVV